MGKLAAYAAVRRRQPEPPTPELEIRADAANPAATEEEATVATANMVATEQAVTVGTPIMAATEQGANNAVDTSPIAIEDTNAGGGAASLEEELKTDDELGLEACDRDDDEPGLDEFDRGTFMEAFRAENRFGPVDVDDVNIGDESFLCSAESDDEDSTRERQLAAQAKDPKKFVEALEDIIDKPKRQKPIREHEILHVIEKTFRRGYRLGPRSHVTPYTIVIWYASTAPYYLLECHALHWPVLFRVPPGFVAHAA
ncbi:uncharacterized protein PITG_15115 [Phytophthora infestans T30-4]|uniref:Uncharacterized protein n=1 Tax=Phytophthora infestans (strain T30-4) TaxID=403677 RepID=D0NRP7_PHYIT|nr:uncharacterized protein PITG_15115 [Phytophthora infestans T30-4]EEY63397.1 conserved hypothetical protein [Phytophthora infestans T30-4]|eukprot:XP_002898282.1 conserved hypothetical protein [Phytophthora infestans T30-4]